MCRLALAIPAMVGAAGTCAAARMERQADGPAPACAIEIEFTERRYEIDMGTLERVLAFIEASPLVDRAVDEHREPGQNGVLCLVIDDRDRALQVFEQLSNLIPPHRARLPRLKPPPAVILRYTGPDIGEPRK